MAALGSAAFFGLDDSRVVMRGTGRERIVRVAFYAAVVNHTA